LKKKKGKARKRSQYGSLLQNLKATFAHIPKKRFRQFLMLLVGMVTVAIVETTSLGVISLFVTSIATPEQLLSSDLFTRAIGFLGIERAWFTSQRLVSALGLTILGLVLIKNTVRGVVKYGVAKFAALVQANVAELLLSRYLAVDYEWHLRQNPHNLQVAMGWRRHFGLFLNNALGLVSDTVLVSVMLIGVTVVRPAMMLSIIGVLGVASFIIYAIMRRLIDKNAERVQKYSKAGSLASALIIHGMKDIRIFGLEGFLLNDFSGKANRLASYKGKKSIYSQLPTWIMEAIGFSIIVLSILVMFSTMNASSLEVLGTISLLAVTAWRVLPAVNRILSGASTIRESLPFMKDFLAFVKEIDTYMSRVVPGWRGGRRLTVEKQRVASVGPESRAKQALQFSEGVEFKEVFFSYNSLAGDETVFEALSSVTCRIPKGASVGLVGHSGAGKSTFVDLFIGLLRPTTGQILVDGTPLAEAELPRWRRQIGYVPQHPYIMDASLAENIAFGKSNDEIDEDYILDLCSKASIDYIGDLERGVYTRIGNRGTRLSGGQRQRVSIARALYNQPDILVFDEATSALDTKSEKEIQSTIDSFKGSQTLLIIAHRLTTVEDCDTLIWLERGGVVDIGTPAEILPRYRRMQGQEG
jgi:ATP-binding cassette, subfamily B, bacterial PglK